MGLNNFILECEKDNKNLRKDVEYYKNKANRVEQQLKQKEATIDKAREYIEKNKFAYNNPLTRSIYNVSKCDDLLSILDGDKNE